MIPLGLRILLGEVDPPQETEWSKSRSRATISDWLEFNGITRETVRQILTDIKPKCDASSVYCNSRELINLSSEEAWSLCATALQTVFPSLSTEIERIKANTPKCLQPKVTKHSKPFTYDIGFGEMPFVSLHYRNRPSDLLTIAHEFGHALQIVASWEAGGGQMPPVARECCAFMAELAVLNYSESSCTYLTTAHQAGDTLYFGQHKACLETDLEDDTALYRYEWNYPPARLLSSIAFKTLKQDDLWQLFLAAKTSPTWTGIYQEVKY